jgi:hypothetical protein
VSAPAAKERAEKRVIGKPFQAGNPGRPKGTRNKLAETFFDALHKDFLQHGASAIVGAREESPLGYLKVVASVIPQKFEIERTNDKVSDEELLEVIRAGTEKRLAAPPPPPKPNVEAEGRA